MCASAVTHCDSDTCTPYLNKIARRTKRVACLRAIFMRLLGFDDCIFAYKI